MVLPRYPTVDGQVVLMRTGRKRGGKRRGDRSNDAAAAVRPSAASRSPPGAPCASGTPFRSGIQIGLRSVPVFESASVPTLSLRSAPLRPGNAAAAKLPGKWKAGAAHSTSSSSSSRRLIPRFHRRRTYSDVIDCTEIEIGKVNDAVHSRCREEAQVRALVPPEGPGPMP